MHADKPNPVTGTIALLPAIAVLAVPFYGVVPALVVGAAIWVALAVIRGLDEPSGTSGNKKGRRKKR